MISKKYFIYILIAAVSAFGSPGFYEPWGKDSNLAEPIAQKEADLGLVSKIANAIICFHQEIISPVDGPRSHYRPTSSRYMQLAMHRYGFVKGYLMGCDRLLRENDEPWVYRKIEIDGQIFKYDPAKLDKYK